MEIPINEPTICVLAAEYGATYLLGSELITLKIPGAMTGEAYLFTEVISQPGGGPGFLHSHPAQESITVLEGEFDFSCIRDGRLVVQRGRPGNVVHVPGGIPHTYQNAGATSGRFQAVLSPATDMEGFFRTIGTPVTDRANLPAPAGPPDHEQFLAIARRYHIEPVAVPQGEE